MMVMFNPRSYDTLIMPAARKEPVEPTFEQALRRLEEIVEHLEHGETPLDDSMKMYEEGIALSKVCIDKLSQAERRLKKLGKDMKGNFELFEEGSAEE
jgi:exodeoxyribonuclease VII small subunit